MLGTGRLEGMKPANDNKSPQEQMQERKHALLEMGRVINETREWIQERKREIDTRFEHAYDQTLDGKAKNIDHVINIEELEIELDDFEALVQLADRAIDQAEQNPRDVSLYEAAQWQIKNLQKPLEELKSAFSTPK